MVYEFFLLPQMKLIIQQNYHAKFRKAQAKIIQICMAQETGYVYQWGQCPELTNIITNEYVCSWLQSCLQIALFSLQLCGNLAAD